MSSSTRRIRIGTRASALARWQAEWVAAQLRTLGHEVELVLLSTRGDREQESSLSTFGGQGVFTKELHRALLAGEVDLAVHSLKDLPTERVEGLRLAAVPPRAPVGDVLLTVDGRPLELVPLGAKIGTGSLRRRAQLWHMRPDLVMADIRGNVDTRLAKLVAGEYDALLLAQAGLSRLGLGDSFAWPLPIHQMLPAVGQGALGLETRSDDSLTQAALAPLDDPRSHAAVVAERQLLHALRAGCLAPVAAWCRELPEGESAAGPQLTLEGIVLSGDGAQRIAASHTGSMTAAAELGTQVAEQLLAQGAARLIASARQSSPPPASE